MSELNSAENATYLAMNALAQAILSAKSVWMAILIKLIGTTLINA